ncbi:MAG TPA: DNA-3-methyladenine glycosylase I [Candidatus Eremiobacteraceae bacterium]|nr:DNA-3-methyladenine glycosylase I [Candidatus Eremiobacteraceae bacterium]
MKAKPVVDRGERTRKNHPRIAKPTLSDHLAVMTRAIFQAGLSWAQIDAQWERLVEAFEGFDPVRISRYDHDDVRRILATPGILHSERKIRAAIDNAKEMLELDREHKAFRAYLRSHDTYADLTADLRRKFKYVGDVSAYYYLFRVGEKVPPFGRWIKTVEGDHPRIREMVKQK